MDSWQPDEALVRLSLALDASRTPAPALPCPDRAAGSSPDRR